MGRTFDSSGRRQAGSGTGSGTGEGRSRRERLNALAWLLDNSIRLPGGFRIGLDAILGLVPFLGDAAGVVISAWIMREAARLGAPPSLLARMGFNVAVEGVVGMVPLLGDIFDAAWKANLKNAQLLNRYLDNPVRAGRSNRLFVALLVTVLVLFLIGMMTLSALFFRWLWGQVAG